MSKEGRGWWESDVAKERRERRDVTAGTRLENREGSANGVVTKPRRQGIEAPRARANVSATKNGGKPTKRTLAYGTLQTGQQTPSIGVDSRLRGGLQEQNVLSSSDEFTPWVIS